MKNTIFALTLVFILASCGTSVTGTASKADSTKVAVDTAKVIKKDSCKLDTVKILK